MKRFRYIFALLLLISFIPVVTAFGQTIKQGRDKFTLLTMPYNMRPLTLYRGQLQVNAGYKFAVRTQKYDSDGNIVLLKNKGTGSVYHYYTMEMRYGLTNFLELGAETNLIRRGVRDESTIYVATTLTATERVSVNKLTEVKGMGDILLRASVRPPIQYNWFDLSFTGGMFIPSSKYQPAKPTNTVTNISTTATSSSYTVNYHYNYTNGYGVPVYLLSASVKMSLKNFSFSADWTMRDPVKEGKNIRWEETMVDKAFSYYDKTYLYLLSTAYNLNTSIHYQATGWFDVYLNGSFQKSKEGWTEYWGNKYRNPETQLIMLEPGFELQISPRLTISQVAGFPLKGKNSDAPFYMFTTIRFSNFTFFR
ncbi:MAG: hypothetical protein C0408_04180 [Odoribacter sp.]|nr:hypothetical protein [Odoribacter sp.]